MKLPKSFTIVKKFSKLFILLLVVVLSLAGIYFGIAYQQNIGKQATSPDYSTSDPVNFANKTDNRKVTIQLQIPIEVEKDRNKRYGGKDEDILSLLINNETYRGGKFLYMSCPDIVVDDAYECPKSSAIATNLQVQEEDQLIIKLHNVRNQYTVEKISAIVTDSKYSSWWQNPMSSTDIPLNGNPVTLTFSEKEQYLVLRVSGKVPDAGGWINDSWFKISTHSDK